MKANYGVDAPGVVSFLGWMGATCILVGLLQPMRWPLYPGISMAATSLTMFLGSKVIKLRIRDQIISNLNLKGDEQVLDVGCGRGLMLIAAAKKLTTGKATGIDLWRSVDQSGNKPETTLQNAKAEGVENKIELQTGDMTNMPFPDNSFDVVVSSWAIHNIPNKEGRAKAIKEIVRVLKPGGKLSIIDLSAAKEYVQTLHDNGIKVETSGPNFLFVIPSFTLTATKPF